jgi:hypothetical protein
MKLWMADISEKQPQSLAWQLVVLAGGRQRQYRDRFHDRGRRLAMDGDLGTIYKSRMY